MSRIGKQILTVPQDVSVTFAEGVLAVKGGKTELARKFPSDITFLVEGSELRTVIRDESDRALWALWGTSASHAENMIDGVTKGFTKRLEVQGIGYRAEMAGNQLKLSLGFSHPVFLDIPGKLKVAVEKNVITITGADKELVGQFAADLVAKKKPEPYKGKGIRYEGQIVPVKQGKKTVA